MDFFKGILRKLDIFGVPFGFKYNKKENYPTALEDYLSFFLLLWHYI